MAKAIFGFTIKPASIVKTKKDYNLPKAVKVRKVSSSISKLFQAVVINDNGELKARLISSPVEESQTEFRVLSFTKDSFSLKGKTHVFHKKKDINNKRICAIRSHIDSIINCGVEAQYDVLYEGLLIKGRVITENDKSYFNYESLVAFTENGSHIDEPSLIGINK